MRSNLLSAFVLRIFLFILILNFCSNSVKAQAKQWIAPASAISAKNPTSNDPVAIKTGKTLYVSYCVPCHGNSGKGDGPAAAALNPKPANHTSAMIQAESDGSLYFKISEGRAPMPKYKTTLTEAQRWALVSYIKTLGKKS